MRRVFNEAKIAQRASDGEFRVHRSANRHLKIHALPDECPFCTHSQELQYFDPASNAEVARVHQYLRPDGTIGASGMPDPKVVCIGGVEYHLHRGAPRGALTPKKNPALRELRRLVRKARYYLKRLWAWLSAFW